MSTTAEKLLTVGSLLREAQRKLELVTHAHANGHSNYRNCVDQLHALTDSADALVKKL